jgi:hypothetical protein
MVVEGHLMQFPSCVDGEPADVNIVTSRISWTIAGQDRLVRMVPTTAISSVVVANRRRRKATLIVCTPRSRVEFDVRRDVADEAQRILAELFAHGARRRCGDREFSLKVRSDGSDLLASNATAGRPLLGSHSTT